MSPRLHILSRSCKRLHVALNGMGRRASHSANRQSIHRKAKISECCHALQTFGRRPWQGCFCFGFNSRNLLDASPPQAWHRGFQGGGGKANSSPSTTPTPPHRMSCAASTIVSCLALGLFNTTVIFHWLFNEHQINPPLFACG